MTKVAISCSGSSLESKINPRFGRANDFLIVDSETMEFTHIDNSQINQIGSGAGIKTSEMVAKSGAEVVLTGSVGPKASQALTAGNIKFYEGFDNMTVKEAINKFKSL